MSDRPRVAVIGLDCAEPSLVFDRWLGDLPNIAAVAEAGTWGRMRSVDPPITVPAWSCMTSGRDPGDLGIYGFRNRRDHAYDAMMTADARAVRADRIWDRVGRAGLESIVIGVPQTYPPPAIRGALVADFLTPDPRRDVYTHPPELRAEVEAVAGGYEVDVRNFRSDDRDRILAEIYAMTEQHFAVARHLLDTRPWDFFMLVEIGLDRLHHAFWRYLDERHPRHEPGHRYAGVIKAYYEYLDEEIGELLERFDDDTLVMIVSDHGARPMEGAICVNEWLVDEGYLVLAGPRPAPGTPLRDAGVDWSRTRAWGEGGYYCRLCLNVRGRERKGIVAPDEYEPLRTELAERLEALGGPDGPIGTRAHRPEDLWPRRRGIPPDLLVYFGDLAWRSNGTLGHGRHFTFDNDTGPDDANHAQHGLWALRGPGVEAGRRDDLDLLDVAPTILARYGLRPPPGLRGRVIGRAPAPARPAGGSASRRG